MKDEQGRGLPDDLGLKLYALRWAIFGANLLFGATGEFMLAGEFVLYVSMFVLLLILSEWLRRRVALMTVHALLVPIDIVCISYSIAQSGGIASDTYLLYLVETLLVTLYSGTGPGLITTMISLTVYSFLIFPDAQTAAQMWSGLYRITIILLFAVGVTYVGFHLRRQVLLNAQMAEENRRLANTDLLTGLGNARLFYTELDALLAEFRSGGKPFCLIMFDCDNLKSINDEHGHDAGDMLIRHVAAIAGESFGAYGRVMRYAGDEFYVLLNECGPAMARSLADEFLQSVESRSVSVEDGGVRTTVSGGLIVLHEGTDRGLSRQNLLRMVDQALYESKHDGRNRMTTYKVTN